MSCTEDHSRYIRAFIARDAAFKEAHPRPGVGTWRFGPWLFAKGQYLSQGTLEPGWEFPDAAEVGQDPTPPTEATEHVQKWGVTPHPEYIQTSTVEAVRGVTPQARDNADRSGVAVPLDLDRVRQLQAEGKGWRTIAAEMEKETGVAVSFMTIKRRVERATKALV